MNDVLFIGGSGFVGTRLIEITRREFTITNFDKNQSPYFPEISILGDVRNPADIEKVMQNKHLVVLLAAEHRDDVSPVSLYYDVNVNGTQNVVETMNNTGVKNIIFTSSVAVYGLNKKNPDERHPVEPFNHYGKSKWQAEEALREWFIKDTQSRSLTIIRPTVIFGERNRGNVYNLLKQIASGKFFMVGNGNNLKSMAYVGNIAAFIKYYMKNIQPGYRIYNYIDKPDLTMNELVMQIEKSLNRKIPSIHIPYWCGILGGMGCDVLSIITRKKFQVSSVRIKKFCATTQFDTTFQKCCDFKAPYKLTDGLHNTLYYEFANRNKDEITFN